MRTLEALKKLAEKCTAKSTDLSGNTVDEVVKAMAENYSVTLVSPDKSVWDISIANDGTISGTKRT